MKKRYILVFLFLFLAIASVFFYFKFTILDDKEVKKEYEIKSTETEAVKEMETVTIYVPDSDRKALVLKKITIPKYEVKREKIGKIFEVLKKDGDSIIPASASLINVFVQNDKLYLNFDKGIQDFSKESSTEMMLIYSLVNTIVANTGINKIKIIVEGKEIDTLGGFVNSRDFFEMDTLLIKGD